MLGPSKVAISPPPQTLTRSRTELLGATNDGLAAKGGERHRRMLRDQRPRLSSTRPLSAGKATPRHETASTPLSTEINWSSTGLGSGAFLTFIETPRAQSR